MRSAITNARMVNGDSGRFKSVVRSCAGKRLTYKTGDGETEKGVKLADNSADSIVVS
jgi:hypothetical protein